MSELRKTGRMAGGIFLAAVLLAGCGPQESTYFNSVNLDAPGPDTCGAMNYAYLVGQPVGQLDVTAVPFPKRVIGVDTLVTADFIPERINFRLDIENNIAQVYCG